VLADWDGSAAEGYRARVKDFVATMDEQAKDFDSTAHFLENASQEIKAAEDIVKAIIQEFLEWAIATIVAALAAAFFSFGASLAAGEGAVSAEAATAMARIMSVVHKVEAFCKRIEKLIEELKKSERVEKRMLGWSMEKGKGVVDTELDDIKGMKKFHPATAAKSKAIQDAQQDAADTVDDHTDQDDVTSPTDPTAAAMKDAKPGKLVP
jgi:uncharacterized protein YukE